MKTLLNSAAAIVLGLSFQAAVLASDGNGKPGNHISQNSSPVAQNKSNEIKPVPHKAPNENKFIVKDPIKKAPIEQVKKGEGKYAACKSFKDFKGPCYYGKECKFWSNHCWNAAYGCNIYWCPKACEWFYWCPPYGCYLPVEYCPAGVYVFAEQ